MVALVTGGGRGIGQGVALRLAREGWSVAVTARSAEQLNGTVAAAEGKMTAIPADIADPASVHLLTRRVETELGPIDLLVNNAAAPGPLGPFWENDPGEWWRCQEVNVRGPMMCCHEIIPGMITRQRGRIVNVVSGAGCFAVPDMSAYVASKTALIRMSEQLALELRPHGVAVFPIRPGIVRTAMVEQARTRIPLVQKLLDEGREVTPDVVAELVLFLASGQADALSGRLISVDRDYRQMAHRAEEALREEVGLLRTKEL